MRHTKVASGRLLLLLSVGVALSACSATASEDAIPYGYGGVGPAYYSDPAYLGDEPFYGDFGFEGDVFVGRDHDHHERHDFGHGEHGHVALHDGGHAFGHDGFGHGGFGHGGGHGGGGHGR